MKHMLPQTFTGVRSSTLGGLSVYPKKYLPWMAVLFFLIGSSIVFGQSREAMLEQARTYRAQPENSSQIRPEDPNDRNFGSGTPFNDIIYTILDTSYMEGETTGYDYFCPADIGDEYPGEDRLMMIRCVNNLDLDSGYSSPQGDRIVLGVPENPNPFFLSGTDGIDNEWVVIFHFNYRLGHIQLRGTPEEYALLYATTDEGVATEGYYLFSNRNGTLDLIAFIFPCDFIYPPISGAMPSDPTFLCNDEGSLSLDNPEQFRFVTTNDTTPALDIGFDQFGTPDHEMVHGVVADTDGNTYVYGASDGNFTGNEIGRNEVFVIKHDTEGNRLWVTEVGVSDGGLLFDAIADGQYLYAAGRTHGAIAGFTSGGQWDAILLKLDLETGAVVASDQWGNSKLDGYGNITLDDAGNLYVSGAGSPEDATSTDSGHLIAKHSAETLQNIWRVIDEPEDNPVFVSEAWGGISYIPSDTRGEGEVVVGGWYMTNGGSNGFVSVFENVHTTTPRRAHTLILESNGVEADWVLDNTFDSEGNIYVAGFTTGNLYGTHQGEGDNFVAKYDGDLNLIDAVQFGTPESDGLRKLEIDSDDNLYAIGYTYGDYAKTNANANKDTGDVIVQKLNSELALAARLQLGTSGEERGFPFVDRGILYLSGITEAVMKGNNVGGFDGFIVTADTETLTPDELPALLAANPPEEVAEEDENGEEGEIPETDITVYNVISTNPDGLNDFFRIDGIENYPDNRLQIYNRNGILEYDTTNYGIGDNLFYGKSQKTDKTMQGTYLYLLEYRSENGLRKKTGYLQIF